MKFFGGTTLCDQKNSQKIEEDYFAQYGETISTLTAIPNGYYPPTCWRLPMKAGNMISKNQIIGAGSIPTANANMGFDLGATLVGQGGFYQAIGELVADLLATISGTGGISSAELEGIVEGMATLTGSGDINGVIEAIADLQATLTGQGDILADLEAIGEMAATIKGYGDLSVEGLRDAIWNAVASNYNVIGTMGQKLNSAAVGGVDYDALAEAVLDAEISGRPIGSLGKTVEDTKKKANMIPGLY
jgi:hypothetical protein